MRKIILISTALFIFNLASAAPGLEITLANQAVGAPVYNDPWDMYAAHESNSPELNLILQNYGTYSYIWKGSLMPKIHVGFTNPDTNNFIAALIASGIVASAMMSDEGQAAGMLNAQLLTANIGTPDGYENGIVTTNDQGLNAIFQNYNVYGYQQTYPSSTWDSLLRFYTVSCNCDNALLKTALDNYSSIIEATEWVSVAYLANSQFPAAQTTVYPNPFEATFDIQSNEKFLSYAIYDFSGKQIVNANSKSLLDSRLQNLAGGIYILQLRSDSGNYYTQKLIKK